MTSVSTSTMSGLLEKNLYSSNAPSSWYSTLRAVQGESLEAMEGSTMERASSMSATSLPVSMILPPPKLRGRGAWGGRGDKGKASVGVVMRGAWVVCGERRSERG